MHVEDGAAATYDRALKPAYFDHGLIAERFIHKGKVRSVELFTYDF